MIFLKSELAEESSSAKKHFLEWMDANFGKERNNT